MPGFEFWSEKERNELNDVVQSGVLMRYGFEGLRKQIWKSKELESEICKFFGSEYAQLTSSGTSALTTALASLGIGYGDEVIIPSFTFVASFEAILSVSAVPVIVDIDDSLTLNADAVIKAITPKTKAVMPVHMCGSMAEMDALGKICKDNHLFLIEDACQSIGASYKGKMLGTLGDAGAFSFDFVKTMTCGEGGVVLTRDKTVYTKCDGFSDHGHDHLGTDRGADLHPFIGYNFRISELHAAVGLAQIRRLPEFLAIQKMNHQLLKGILSQLPEISFRRIPDPEGDSCTFLSWFLPSEEVTRAVINELKLQGTAPGNFYWYDNNWHYIRNWGHLKNGLTLNKLHPEIKAAVQQQARKDFSASDAIISRCISTAISLLWSEEQITEKGEKIITAVKKVLNLKAVHTP